MSTTRRQFTDEFKAMELVHMVSGLAMKRGPSVDFCGVNYAWFL
ncbi:MAG: hypothetical protein WBE80_15885 [Methylocella sp.]